MGLRLAHEYEMEAVKQRAPAHGLMGVDVVAQERGLKGRIMGAVLVNPAFARGRLAVLLLMAVLGHNEFRAQGNGSRFSRRDDHRSDGTVIIGFLAAGVLDAGTL